MSSVESAGLGGAAHLVNFKGTDTVRGLEIARDYYKGGITGFSIPASEHSTITSWGAGGEVAAMKNMLEKYPTGLMACVSDSWDIFNACANIWGGELVNLVQKRDGTVVVRPDSGDPLIVLPQILGIMAEKFGYETNQKGFKVLNPKIRVIQGDGITFDSLDVICETVKKAGFSLDNLAFGSGGGLLQMLNRDTQRFAFKCSAVKVKEKWRDVYKQPSTDLTKASKRGRVTLIKTTDGFQTVSADFDSHYQPGYDCMETVFQNGMLTRDHTFDEVRCLARV